MAAFNEPLLQSLYFTSNLLTVKQHKLILLVNYDQTFADRVYFNIGNRYWKIIIRTYNA